MCEFSLVNENIYLLLLSASRLYKVLHYIHGRTSNYFLYSYLVLMELLEAMHTLREKHDIKSHCQCVNKQNVQAGKFPSMNGVSQVRPIAVLNVKHNFVNIVLYKTMHI